MATIRITDLHLKTIIGINDWERDIKQDIVINIAIDFNASKPAQSDDINDTIDYKTLTKQIIAEVEQSDFYLLEKLVDVILNIILAYPLVEAAHVRIDKPQALRFSKSVSVEMTKRN